MIENLKNKNHREKESEGKLFKPSLDYTVVLFKVWRQAKCIFQQAFAIRNDTSPHCSSPVFWQIKGAFYLYNTSCCRVQRVVCNKALLLAWKKKNQRKNQVFLWEVASTVPKMLLYGDQYSFFSSLTRRTSVWEEKISACKGCNVGSLRSERRSSLIREERGNARAEKNTTASHRDEYAEWAWKD